MSGRLGLLPPPLWGRVGEGGGAICNSEGDLMTPTPNPSPQGGGAHTEHTAMPSGFVVPGIRVKDAEAWRY